MLVGTYSSVLTASPLAIELNAYARRRGKGGGRRGRAHSGTTRTRAAGARAAGPAATAGAAAAPGTGSPGSVSPVRAAGPGQAARGSDPTGRPFVSRGRPDGHAAPPPAPAGAGG